MTKLYVISDFNAQNLNAFLRQETIENRPLDAEFAPFNQLFQELSKIAMQGHKPAHDYLLIWPDFEKITGLNPQSFFNLTADETSNKITAFCNLIANVASKFKAVLVPTWAPASHTQSFAATTIDTNSLSYKALKANLQLIEATNSIPNLHILNANKWCEASGSAKAHNPKLWYMGKILFGNEVFKAAATDIAAKIRQLLGHATKLIILDLDNTLWGGIIGEVGKEALVLGGHDPLGEAFVAFQSYLKSLKEKGVLLAIASKNDEAVALDAIKNHPEMVLRMEDFVAWQINWQDKAENIKKMVETLNLGLQSCIFIDDNPAERSRVSSALPDVYVPDWPKDKMLYSKALMKLNCFVITSITSEDLKRTELYGANVKRTQEMQMAISFDDWLATLETEVRIEALNADNLMRITQLFNKTNQMNLTTRRLTEEELKTWASEEKNQIYSFRVKDKHGDLGLTGVIGLTVADKQIIITDFILSCRVIGRKIEETMLYFVETKAQELGATNITARYKQTNKNKVCFDFWKNTSNYSFSKESSSFEKKASHNAKPPTNINITNTTAKEK